jgi:hypothetical protein
MVCANAWLFEDHKVVKPLDLETQIKKSGPSGPLFLYLKLIDLALVPSAA